MFARNMISELYAWYVVQRGVMFDWTSVYAEYIRKTEVN
jgi:hypothetical protein